VPVTILKYVGRPLNSPEEVSLVVSESVSPEKRLQLLAAARMKLTAPAYSRATLIMGCGIQEKSEGCYIYDQYGRRFLDLFDAYGNQSFGYGHPRILDALRRQLDSGHTNSCKIFFEEGPIKVGEALAALTNGALPCSYLTNGGAEAVDGVLKLARAHTRRPKFITAENAYHGKTFAALSAACRPEYEKMFEPMMPQFQAVPFGDIEAMETAIDDQTAAVLLEPIQAEGGIVVPDDEYFPRLRQLCTERGALLICDETQTGFGRTGRFFGFEHFGIVPDLISIGKSFGGGMLPIAAILCREEYWMPFRVAPLSFGSSLGGNPLACAVGLETLAMASDPGFLADIRRKGDYVGERLHAIGKAFPQLVAGVRGKGLLWGVKLYDNAVGGLLIRQLFERGAISTFALFDSRVFRIEPPLIITLDQLKDGMDALEEAFEVTAAYVGSLPKNALGASYVEQTLDLSADVKTVWAELSDPERLYRFSPLVTGSKPAGPMAFTCDGLIDDIGLEWTDIIEADPVGHSIVQRATGGFWNGFVRHWTIEPKGHGSRVTLKIEWSVGAATFERVLSLRIRYSLEKAVLQSLSGLTNALRRTRPVATVGT
jgi:putrescine aminotransferase